MCFSQDNVSTIIVIILYILDLIIDCKFNCSSRFTEHCTPVQTVALSDCLLLSCFDLVLLSTVDTDCCCGASAASDDLKKIEATNVNPAHNN